MFVVAHRRQEHMALTHIVLGLVILTIGALGHELCSAGSEDSSGLLQTRANLHHEEGAADQSLKNMTKSKDDNINKGHTDATDACAVCFIGELRSLNETAESIRLNFLERIAAEDVSVHVFVSAPRRGPFEVADFGLSSDVAHRVVLRDFVFEPEPAVKDFEELLMKVPAQSLEHYKQTPGSFLGPAWGRAGNSLRFYRHESKCLEMIERAEQADSMRYKWVIRTRPDFMWLGPHPPLSLMSLDYLWTPNTESGLRQVNPRHMVGSRAALVEAVLRRYEYIMTGNPLMHRVHAACRIDDEKTVVDKPCRSLVKFTHHHTLHDVPMWDEKFSKTMLDSLAIRVGLFGTVAYVVKCPAWAECWRTKVLKPGDVCFDSTYPREEQFANRNGALWKAGTVPGKSCWKHIHQKELGISQNCDSD